MSSDSDPVDALRPRRPLPLPVAGPARDLVPCLECGKCCTYVGVGINSPTTARYATDVLWYLYHEGVYVHCDGDGEWSVHFETRCRNLTDDLLCRIYEERPHICRAFDNETCEVNSDQGIATSYRHPREFLDWLRTNHPRVLKTIEKKYLPKGV